EQTAAAPADGLPLVRADPRRDQLAVAAADPSDDERTADHRAVQTVLPDAGAKRQGADDLDQRRHGRRQAEGEGQIPGARKERAFDEAVHEASADVLERQSADGAAERKERHRQREVDERMQIAARRAAARLWPDALDRRAVHPDRTPR